MAGARSTGLTKKEAGLAELAVAKATPLCYGIGKSRASVFIMDSRAVYGYIEIPVFLQHAFLCSFTATVILKEGLL
jgi:hypothetical protein